MLPGPQLLALDEELNFAVLAAWAAPDRDALSTFVGTVVRIRWSNYARTAFIHGKVLHYSDSFTGGIPTLCADMSAWVQSGYTKLGPGTQLIVRQRDAYRALLRRTPENVVQSPLAGYEDAGEQALAHRLDIFTESLNPDTVQLEAVKHRIEEVVGLGLAS